jgi:hypothetical protein
MIEDPPLVPLAVVYGEEGLRRSGAEIIDLAGIRLQAGTAASSQPVCQHKALIYNQIERRCWCEDCTRTVDNFDVVMIMVRAYGTMLREARLRLAQAREATKAAARRLATKELDRVWGGKMVPNCPHCQRGLLPEDFANGAASTQSKELEVARRARQLQPP